MRLTTVLDDKQVFSAVSGPPGDERIASLGSCTKNPVALLKLSKARPLRFWLRFTVRDRTRQRYRVRHQYPLNAHIVCFVRVEDYVVLDGLRPMRRHTVAAKAVQGRLESKVRSLRVPRIG